MSTIATKQSTHSSPPIGMTVDEFEGRKRGVVPDRPPGDADDHVRRLVKWMVSRTCPAFRSHRQFGAQIVSNLISAERRLKLF